MNPQTNIGSGMSWEEPPRDTNPETTRVNIHIATCRSENRNKDNFKSSTDAPVAKGHITAKEKQKQDA